MKYLIIISVLMLTACKRQCGSVEECELEQKLEEARYKPVLVTEIDGIKLYRVRDDYARNNYVWFSALGTSYDECYMVGKVRHCEQINVTNPAKEQ